MATETAANKTAAKTTAAKKTTASKATEAKEESTRVSPIKRSTRTVLSLEVDGVQYTGDVEVTTEQIEALDELAGKWDEAQTAYQKLTQELVEKLEELGIEPEKPKRVTSDAKKIRRWANRTGVEVNAQGMIPNDVREQYEKAKAKGELKDDEL